MSPHYSLSLSLDLPLSPDLFRPPDHTENDGVAAGLLKPAKTGEVTEKVNLEGAGVQAGVVVKIGGTYEIGLKFQVSDDDIQALSTTILNSKHLPFWISTTKSFKSPDFTALTSLTEVPRNSPNLSTQTTASTHIDTVDFADPVYTDQSPKTDGNNWGSLDSGYFTRAASLDCDSQDAITANNPRDPIGWDITTESRNHQDSITPLSPTQSPTTWIDRSVRALVNTPPDSPDPNILAPQGPHPQGLNPQKSLGQPPLTPPTTPDLGDPVLAQGPNAGGCDPQDLNAQICSSRVPPTPGSPDPVVFKPAPRDPSAKDRDGQDQIAQTYPDTPESTGPIITANTKVPISNSQSSTTQALDHLGATVSVSTEYEEIIPTLPDHGTEAPNTNIPGLDLPVSSQKASIAAVSQDSDSPTDRAQNSPDTATLVSTPQALDPDLSIQARSGVAPTLSVPTSTNGHSKALTTLTNFNVITPDLNSQAPSTTVLGPPGATLRGHVAQVSAVRDFALTNRNDRAPDGVAVTSKIPAHQNYDTEIFTATTTAFNPTDASTPESTTQDLIAPVPPVCISTSPVCSSQPPTSTDSSHANPTTLDRDLQHPVGLISEDLTTLVSTSRDFIAPSASTRVPTPPDSGTQATIHDVPISYSPTQQTHDIQGFGLAVPTSNIPPPLVHINQALNLDTTASGSQVPTSRDLVTQDPLNAVNISQTPTPRGHNIDNFDIPASNISVSSDAIIQALGPNGAASGSQVPAPPNGDNQTFIAPAVTVSSSQGSISQALGSLENSSQNFIAPISPTLDRNTRRTYSTVPRLQVSIPQILKSLDNDPRDDVVPIYPTQGHNTHPPTATIPNPLDTTVLVSTPRGHSTLGCRSDSASPISTTRDSTAPISGPGGSILSISRGRNPASSGRNRRDSAPPVSSRRGTIAAVSSRSLSFSDINYNGHFRQVLPPWAPTPLNHSPQDSTSPVFGLRDLIDLAPTSKSLTTAVSYPQDSTILISAVGDPTATGRDPIVPESLFHDSSNIESNPLGITGLASISQDPATLRRSRRNRVSPGLSSEVFTPLRKSRRHRSSPELPPQAFSPLGRSGWSRRGTIAAASGGISASPERSPKNPISSELPTQNSTPPRRGRRDRISPELSSWAFTPSGHSGRGRRGTVTATSNGAPTTPDSSPKDTISSNFSPRVSTSLGRGPRGSSVSKFTDGNLTPVPGLQDTVIATFNQGSSIHCVDPRLPTSPGRSPSVPKSIARDVTPLIPGLQDNIVAASSHDPSPPVPSSQNATAVGNNSTGSIPRKFPPRVPTPPGRSRSRRDAGVPISTTREATVLVLGSQDNILAASNRDLSSPVLKSNKSIFPIPKKFPPRVPTPPGRNRRDSGVSISTAYDATPLLSGPQNNISTVSNQGSPSMLQNASSPILNSPSPIAIGSSGELIPRKFPPRVPTPPGRSRRDRNLPIPITRDATPLGSSSRDVAKGLNQSPSVGNQDSSSPGFTFRNFIAPGSNRDNIPRKFPPRVPTPPGRSRRDRNVSISTARDLSILETSLRDTTALGRNTGDLVPTVSERDHNPTILDRDPTVQIPTSQGTTPIELNTQNSTTTALSISEPTVSIFTHDPTNQASAFQSSAPTTMVSSPRSLAVPQDLIISDCGTLDSTASMPTSRNPVDFVPLQDIDSTSRVSTSQDLSSSAFDSLDPISLKPLLSPIVPGSNHANTLSLVFTHLDRTNQASGLQDPTVLEPISRDTTASEPDAQNFIGEAPMSQDPVDSLCSPRRDSDVLLSCGDEITLVPGPQDVIVPVSTRWGSIGQLFPENTILVSTSPEFMTPGCDIDPTFSESTSEVPSEDPIILESITLVPTQDLPLPIYPTGEPTIGSDPQDSTAPVSTVKHPNTPVFRSRDPTPESTHRDPIVTTLLPSASSSTVPVSTTFSDPRYSDLAAQDVNSLDPIAPGPISTLGHSQVPSPITPLELLTQVLSPSNHNSGDFIAPVSGYDHTPPSHSNNSSTSLVIDSLDTNALGSSILDVSEQGQDLASPVLASSGAADIPQCPDLINPVSLVQDLIAKDSITQPFFAKATSSPDSTTLHNPQRSIVPLCPNQASTVSPDLDTQAPITKAISPPDCTTIDESGFVTLPYHTQTTFTPSLDHSTQDPTTIVSEPSDPAILGQNCESLATLQSSAETPDSPGSNSQTPTTKAPNPLNGTTLHQHLEDLIDTEKLAPPPPTPQGTTTVDELGHIIPPISTKMSHSPSLDLTTQAIAVIASDLQDLTAFGQNPEDFSSPSCLAQTPTSPDCNNQALSPKISDSLEGTVVDQHPQDSIDLVYPTQTPPHSDFDTQAATAKTIGLPSATTGGESNFISSPVLTHTSATTGSEHLDATNQSPGNPSTPVRLTQNSTAPDCTTKALDPPGGTTIQKDIIAPAYCPLRLDIEAPVVKSSGPGNPTATAEKDFITQTCPTLDILPDLDCNPSVVDIDLSDSLEPTSLGQSSEDLLAPACLNKISVTPKCNNRAPTPSPLNGTSGHQYPQNPSTPIILAQTSVTPGRRNQASNTKAPDPLDASTEVEVVPNTSSATFNQSLEDSIPMACLDQATTSECDNQAPATMTLGPLDSLVGDQDSQDPVIPVYDTQDPLVPSSLNTQALVVKVTGPVDATAGDARDSSYPPCPTRSPPPLPDCSTQTPATPAPNPPDVAATSQDYRSFITPLCPTQAPSTIPNAYTQTSAAGTHGSLDTGHGDLIAPKFPTRAPPPPNHCAQVPIAIVTDLIVPICPTRTPPIPPDINTQSPATRALSPRDDTIIDQYPQDHKASVYPTQAPLGCGTAKISDLPSGTALGHDNQGSMARETSMDREISMAREIPPQDLINESGEKLPDLAPETQAKLRTGASSGGRQHQQLQQGIPTSSRASIQVNTTPALTSKIVTSMKSLGDRVYERKGKREKKEKKGKKGKKEKEGDREEKEKEKEKKEKKEKKGEKVPQAITVAQDQETGETEYQGRTPTTLIHPTQNDQGHMDINRSAQDSNTLASTNLESRNVSPAAGDDYGLKVLHDGNNPGFDIVAIHGLDGHREKTWMAENGTLWLKDYLPEIVPNARIFTYGYDGRTHDSTLLSCQTIQNLGRDFVGDLSLMRRHTKTEERPIIFLAHSIGGIILKSALIHSNTANERHLAHHEAIKTSTYGILFFGTPHQGTESFRLEDIFLAASLSGSKRTNETVVKNLGEHSEWLQQQIEQYTHISAEFETKFFYETYATNSPGGDPKIIVPQYSAVVPGTTDVEVFPVNSDHAGMVKYKSAEEGAFQRTAACISLMAEQAAEKVSTNWRKWRRIQAAKKSGIEINFKIPFWGDYLRNSNFTGRKKLLNKLYSAIIPDSKRNLVVLHGLGGIGKTQVALEYVYAHVADYDSIFWITGTSEETTISGFREIARRLIQHGKETEKLGYLEIAQHYDMAGFVDQYGQISEKPEYSKPIVNAVKRWFNREGNQNWLLVFDNVNDLESFKIDSYFPSCRYGSIIITTRRPELVYLGGDLEVQEMTDEEGVRLLLRTARSNFDQVSPEDKTALILAKKLGFLPLAIVQAGAYVATRNWSFEKYIEVFSVNFNQVFRKAPSGNHENQTIITTWEMSFEAIENENTGATALLLLCSFLHFEKISTDMLHRGKELEKHDLTLDDALSLLRSYSLVQYNYRQREQFYIHPIVHQWARERLRQHRGEAGFLIKAKEAVTVLGCAVQKSNKSTDLWMLAHVETVLYNTHQYLQKRISSTNSDQTSWLKYILQLARTSRRQDKVKEELQVQVKNVLEKVLVEEHPHILMAMSDVALTYSDKGRWEEAEKLQKYVMEVGQRNFGRDHPENWAVMVDLSVVHRARGQWVDAEKLQLRVMEALTKDYGKEHVETLMTMANLATTYNSHGKQKDAETLQLQVLEMSKTIFGEKDPNTLAAVASLASTYLSQGKLQEAENLGVQCMDASIQILGEEHPDTLKAMGILALAYRKQGHLGKAEDLQLRVVTAWRRALGDDYPDTLDAMRHLASTYVYQKRWEDAEKLALECFGESEKILGKDHRDTLDAKNILATAYFNKGLRTKAEALYGSKSGIGRWNPGMMERAGGSGSEGDRG